MPGGKARSEAMPVEHPPVTESAANVVVAKSEHRSARWRNRSQPEAKVAAWWRQPSATIPGPGPEAQQRLKVGLVCQQRIASVSASVTIWILVWIQPCEFPCEFPYEFPDTGVDPTV